MIPRPCVAQPAAIRPGPVPRALGGVLLVAGLLVGTAAHAAPRLVTVDWGIAQNLTAMGAPPIGVGQIDGYRSWVAGPRLPSATREIGLRSQPNMELLSQLDPDRILITELYAGQADRLAEVAPVSIVDVYFSHGDGDSDVWDSTIAAVKKLGTIAERPAAARALIARTQSAIRKQTARLPADTKPLLIVQFVDESHVRVYGEGSLVAATAERMGLDNAWQETTTRWGVATVALDRLARISDARIVVMGPVPVGVTDKIADNRIWQTLPAVQHTPPIYIPAVWSFGGLPSASRFARLIADALVNAHAKAPAPGAGWPNAAPEA